MTKYGIHDTIITDVPAKWITMVQECLQMSPTTGAHWS